MEEEHQPIGLALEVDKGSHLLPGEEVLIQWNEENCMISNYRFFYTSAEGPFIISLRNIDSTEPQLPVLSIHCKEGPLYKCSFSTAAVCEDVKNEIKKANSSLVPFAFKYFEACHNDPVQYKDYLTQFKPVGETWKITDEFARMEFDPSVWEISNCNQNFELCPSYPTQLISCILPKDFKLSSVASFRHSQRIPTIVWRHQRNGMVLARCSQPAVSIFCSRNQEDEALFQSILTACSANPGLDAAVPENKETKLLIIDARAYTVAYVNRMRGGGSEFEEYYPQCEIRFMNLPNIHLVRKSFVALRSTLTTYSDQSRWLSQLENTNWLHYLSMLLKTVLEVVEAVEDDCRPVLVHCSDGWDRTPQIVALAELCLDPYYRTTTGFQVLVEREWVSFGHKFADRCGQPECSTDPNERSQVFLQFLDCVYQLQCKFPCSFEFNSAYLTDLARYTYSGLYGNFLCNSIRERDQTVKGKTFSIWSHFSSAPRMFYRNYLYWGAEDERVLRPAFQLTDLHIWMELYMPSAKVSGGEAPTLSSLRRPLDTAALGQALSRHSSDLSLAHESRTSPPRTPSSGFPATPSDDPGGGFLPPPWHVITPPSPNLVQTRLHQLVQEFESIKDKYLRDLQNGKQCSSCRIQENGSPFLVEVSWLLSTRNGGPPQETPAVVGQGNPHQGSSVAPPEEEFEFLSLEECPSLCLTHNFHCRKCGLNLTPMPPPMRCKHQSRPEELVSHKSPVVSTGST